VPQGRVRVIQHLEGGIVETIHVQEGSVVREGDALIQLNLATSGVNRNELLARLDAQVLIRARLDAQSRGVDPVYPEVEATRQPDMVRAQNRAYEARKRELENSLSVIESQMRQKELEVQELEARMRSLQTKRRDLGSSTGPLQQQLRQKELEVQEMESRAGVAQRNLELARERRKMSESLLKQGLVPRMEHLQLEAETESLEGELQNIRASIPRARASMAEIRARMADELQAVNSEINNLEPSLPRARVAVQELKQKAEGERAKFRREAEEEITSVEQALSRIGELLKEATEQRGRALVRSPIDGVVKNLASNTIGGVIKPGDPIMQIVPTDETLVVQARLNPTDRGYVREGQRATVKVSTYDYVRYGGLDGEVDLVAPDASLTKDGTPYFQVTVKTQKTYLGENPGDLPITPGMQATIDIHTGTKSVMDYIVKPVLKLRHEAFRER